MEFSVADWLREDQAAGPNAHQVTMSMPQNVFCWSRQSEAEGGEYLYGEAGALRTLRADVDVGLRGADLNAGYPAAWVRKADPDDAVPVEVILYGAAYGGVDLSRTSVVTFRNNLNKLLLTPLQPRDGWVIDGAWVGSALYLDIVKRPPGQNAAAPGTDQDRFTYYGYKFEALATEPPAGQEEQAAHVVDCTGEFAIMVQMRLGRHLVTMAAETDAWQPPPPDLAMPEDGSADYVGYVELKTFVIPVGDRAHERLLRDKYPRWWLQSYLAGVPTLVLGGRDRAGVLREVTRLPVTRLPAIAAERGVPFDAARLLRFGDAALDRMCEAAASRPGEHWRFEFDPARGVISGAVVPDGKLPERVIAALAAQGGGGEGEGGGGEGGAPEAEAEAEAEGGAGEEAGHEGDGEGEGDGHPHEGGGGGEYDEEEGY
ncbi:hypothetical protein HYH02_012070 [Chlamydomonas schloesseri]|uniref:Decapping nuclease n=1 Tax=Chlamydomonas schloesseri TaxID=2026947 RepID=A0A835TBB0_9CHLO|nr:hypothetical protein HYH02_012070 [Chlamydomonas schloesseri]|eukprot:KAG2434870.1 hypothetical protein HYH02_012070 [Chlamydomonas schloesseri]